MTGLVTPDELRDHLDVDFGELDDTRAELIIAGVTGLILDHVRRPNGFVTRTETFELDGTGNHVLLLPSYPVTAITSVVEDPRGAATVLVDDVDFDWKKNGILRRLGGGRWRDRGRWYHVAGTTGYTATPDAAKLVCLRVSARVVSNPEGLVQENAGGYVSGFGFDEHRLGTLAPADRRDLQPLRIES